MSARLKELYKNEIANNLKKTFSLKSVMAAPRLEKIVLSIGAGSIFMDSGKMDAALEALSFVAGQKACFRKAKKSVSTFKTRTGMNIGLMVTLRKNRMYEFLDRLRNMVLPRIREFKGFKKDSINGRAFSFGIREIGVFPEVREFSKGIDNLGLNITFVSSSANAETFKSLLVAFGFPMEGDE